MSSECGMVSKETTTHYPPSGLPAASDHHPPASPLPRTVPGGAPARAHARKLAARSHSAGWKQVARPSRMDGRDSHDMSAADPPARRLSWGSTPTSRSRRHSSTPPRRCPS